MPFLRLRNDECKSLVRCGLWTERSPSVVAGGTVQGGLLSLRVFCVEQDPRFLEEGLPLRRLRDTPQTLTRTGWRTRRILR